VQAFRARVLADDPTVATPAAAHTLLALSLEAGRPLQDVSLVAEKAIPQARSRGDTLWLGGVLQAVALARGQLRTAVELWSGQVASPAARIVQAFGSRENNWVYVLWTTAQYPGLDSAKAATVDSLETSIRLRRFADPVEQAREAGWSDSLVAACLIQRYRISSGDTTGVREHAEQIEARLAELLPVVSCAPGINALLEARSTRTGPAPELDRLETSLLSGSVALGVSKLSLSRLRRQRGEYRQALTLSRVRGRGTGGSFSSVTQYLKEEGDLCALLGDTTGAERAYEHYLVLRDDPDDLARPQVDSVRASLAALRGDEEKP
jgi:hypothetical protein